MVKFSLSNAIIRFLYLRPLEEKPEGSLMNIIGLQELNSQFFCVISALQVTPPPTQMQLQIKCFSLTGQGQRDGWYAIDNEMSAPV